MMTSMRSGGKPNSQRASMTSSALFMSVAESIVIFGPMRQVGCLRASSTVTSANAFDGIGGTTLHGLKNGAVLAINRQQPASATGGQVRDQGAGQNKCFFVG